MGPSGSGKRTALGILEDRFGYVSVTKVEPRNLSRVVSVLPMPRIALSVSAVLSESKAFSEACDTYVESCVEGLQSLRPFCRQLRILFLYRTQAELQLVETTFFHPFVALCGSLKAAVFKECEVMVQLFQRLTDDRARPHFVDEMVFVDTSALSPASLRDVLESQFDTPSRVTLRAPAQFVTRGWNRMRHTLEQIDKTVEFMRRDTERDPKRAGQPLNCLILGESGSGKELVAKRLHQESSSWRPPGAGIPPENPPNSEPEQKPVRIDCAALSPNLIESELFGHVKGAFTGARNTRDGLLRYLEEAFFWMRSALSTRRLKRSS